MSWPEVKLSEVIEYIRGVTFKPAQKMEPYSEGSIVCFTTVNVRKELDITKLTAIDETIVKRDELFIRPGDLLISSANSWELVGKTVYVPDLSFKATAGGFIGIIRPTIIDSRYLYHWITSEEIQLKIRYLGRKTTNISNLSIPRFLNLKIPLPPLNEQERIAAILDKANEIEGATRQAQKMRSELIAATFLDMFGDPIVNPNNFDKVKLESVTKFHKQGLYFNQGYSNSGNQLIRIADMRKDGSLNFGTMPFIEIDSKTQKQFSVEVGDFLFARSGSIGTCAIVREETDAVFGSFIIKFQFTEKLLNDYFIHYYQLPQIEMMIRSMSHGSTNTNINARNIKNLDVIVPPISLQEKFIQIVNSIKQMPNSTDLSSTNLASLSQEIIS